MTRESTDVQRSVGRSVVDHEQIVATIRGVAGQRPLDFLAFVEREGGRENAHAGLV